MLCYVILYYIILYYAIGVTTSFEMSTMENFTAQRPTTGSGAFVSFSYRSYDVVC